MEASDNLDVIEKTADHETLDSLDSSGQTSALDTKRVCSRSSFSVTIANKNLVKEHEDKVSDVRLFLISLSCTLGMVINVSTVQLFHLELLTLNLIIHDQCPRLQLLHAPT